MSFVASRSWQLTRTLPTVPPALSKSGRPMLGAVPDISPHERSSSIFRSRLSGPPHILALLAIQFSKSLFHARYQAQNNRCPPRPSTWLSRLGHRALGVPWNPERSMPYPAQRLSGISRDVAAFCLSLIQPARLLARPKLQPPCYALPRLEFQTARFCPLHPRFPVGRLPYRFRHRESSTDYKNLF